MKAKTVKPSVAAVTTPLINVENAFKGISLAFNLCLIFAYYNTCSTEAKNYWTKNGTIEPYTAFYLFMGYTSSRAKAKGWSIDDLQRFHVELAAANNCTKSIFIRIKDGGNWIIKMRRIYKLFSRPGRYILIVRPTTTLDKPIIKESDKMTEQQYSEKWDAWTVANCSRLGIASHAIGVIVHADKSIFFYDNGCRFLDGGKPFTMLDLAKRCRYIARLYVHYMTSN